VNGTVVLALREQSGGSPEKERKARRGMLICTSTEVRSRKKFDQQRPSVVKSRKGGGRELQTSIFASGVGENRGRRKKEATTFI